MRGTKNAILLSVMTEKHQHENSGGRTALILGATGVVFGDIGTSPIYALKETFHKSGTTLTDIYGVVSLVFWTLTLVVTVKYLTFVMRADNRGEGGILALLALLPRAYHQGSTSKKKVILILILIGTALLFGDGVLTPAISVLSATEGLDLVHEGLGSYSVPITVVILFTLFAVQRKGTHNIGRVFGPIMVVWFLLIAGLGVYRFVNNPEVIVALSPSYAVGFIASHGFGSLMVLSSVILCVTGAEALYADMGHFGRSPIQFAWRTLVGPSLVLCYLGQAAVVVDNPDAARNPFFSLPPNATLTLILVLLATAATVIASQALITGVFSLARQATQLGLFPRLMVRHTSHEHEGQIYVPLVNWAVGLTSIALVITFKTSSALADAYVLAIAGTMAITSVAFHAVAREVWGWSRLKVFPLTAIFLCVDLSFLLSTLGNILKGGWVPVALGSFVLAIMLLWRQGYSTLQRYMAEHAVTWNSLLNELEHGSLVRSPGIGVFMASPQEEVPVALASQARTLHSIPTEVWIVTINNVQQARVDPEPVAHEIAPRIKRVTLNVGYMDEVNVSRILHDHFLAESERVATYYISERRFLATDANNIRHVPEALFSLLHRNSAPVVQYYGLPGDRVISIGTRIDL
ncbi:MAG: potassium transporter Kup [Actinobacteria bacterium]|uniref:Unannotated protein n=1 Tax=freshwater metagenome TaxID=449393 RepID=A0A6J5ZHR3_9ZZZZ|nr:potassium transporter Kup [Actinomycetota bacterium]